MDDRGWTVRHDIIFTTKTNLFRATPLSDESWSLRCIGTDESGDIKWPSDDEVSLAVGEPVRFWDAGDDLDEAIYSVRPVPR